MMYLLTAIALTPGGSSTLHNDAITQHTKQHNETEYPEWNIRNNNNP
jgi:hypothetical protein